MDSTAQKVFTQEVSCFHSCTQVQPPGNLNRAVVPGRQVERSVHRPNQRAVSPAQGPSSGEQRAT
jgi:hypothetical protein